MDNVNKYSQSKSANKWQAFFFSFPDVLKRKPEEFLFFYSKNSQKQVLHL